MSTENLEKPTTDTDRASTSEELIKMYEPEVEMISLFMSGNEERIQEFINAGGLTMERKIGEDGQVDSIKLTDENGKMVWFTDFAWYRKSVEKDLAEAAARDRVN